jgi:hypothetical protein
MKVFIVFSGSYSDRCTSGVFDNKAAAENFIENEHGREKDGTVSTYSDFDIEEWEIDSTCPLSGRIMWLVHMRKNGDVIWCSRQPNGKEPEVTYKHWDSDESKYEDIPVLICTVSARDETHAIKIVNERRLMLIASNSWGIK